MKLKGICLIAAAVLSIGTASLAKDKGTLTKFPNWGVITVPSDIYMQKGTQPMLTAADAGNDVTALFEKIFPLQAETYQVVKKDDADFQYAYLMHYTASLWDVRAAVYGENRENAYLRDIGGRPDPKTLMDRLNQSMASRLPDGFRLTAPVTAKKYRGRVFYEWTVEKSLIINSNAFTETIHGLAWQHGDTMEIAVILGNVAKSGDDDIISTVTDMLKDANKMPKK